MKKSVYYFVLFICIQTSFLSVASEKPGVWISKHATYEISSRDYRHHYAYNEPTLLTGEPQQNGMDWAFHTDEIAPNKRPTNDLMPYIIIDLHNTAEINRIQIVNRKSWELHIRTKGLTAWVSKDKRNWEKIWKATAGEAEYEIQTNKTARYVKLGFEEKRDAAFHLSYVKIFGSFNMNDLNGEWYSTEADKQGSLKIEGNSMRWLGANEEVTGVSHDGHYYIFHDQTGATKLKAELISDKYLEMVYPERIIFKRQPSLPNATPLRLIPTSLNGHWFETNDDSMWTLAFYPEFMAAEKSFWIYQSIDLQNNTYTITAKSGDQSKAIAVNMQDPATIKVTENGKETVLRRETKNKPEAPVFRETVIKGYIDNFTPSDTSIAIYYKCLGPGAPKTYVGGKLPLRLDKHNKFEMKFNFSDPYSIHLRCNNRLTTRVVVRPGQTIMLYVDARTQELQLSLGK